MGESTCLLHSFSYADPNNQGNPNPINVLGESVSFGRFTSESLSWEKWSSFSQKRYVEEAERYAQPGSVAQKKAFFEAHYKRIAAKKAAALLEQANAEKSHETEVEDPICDENSNTHGAQTAALSFHDPQAAVLKSQPQPLVAVCVELDKDDTNVNAEGYNSTVTAVIFELNKVIRADACTENELLPESQLNNEPFTHLGNVEGQNVVSGLEDPGTPQMEKPLLKNLKSNEDTPTSARKRNPVLSSIRSSVFRKASKVPPSPAKSMASVHPRKENVHTPRTKIPTMDLTDKRRSTPKSMKRLVNSTPVKEPNRTTIPPLQKIEGVKVAPSARKATKDCATPLKTPPTKAFVNGVKKHPLTTPSSESIRKVETPVHPTASGSKTTGPKWHIISAVSKSFTACRNKLQSPTLSTPFILRTEERAARRKQKLEEKFNAKDVQKVQLQTKLKEKAETEFRKLRQSLCFKARPLPDFYRERETSINQIKKNPRADLTAGIRPSRTTRGKISQPPLVASIKSNSSKNVWTKDGIKPTRSPTLEEMITHENTSPNIQLSSCGGSLV